MDSIIRVVTSVVGAGALYSAWLALMLSIVSRPASPMPRGLLLTAPVAPALGFGLGAFLGDRLTGRRRMRLLQACLWPLAGCIVGALVVYPFGPMLIVFGMFGLGTAAVVLNEIIARRKARAANTGMQTADTSRRYGCRKRYAAVAAGVMRWASRAPARLMSCCYLPKVK